MSIMPPPAAHGRLSDRFEAALARVAAMDELRLVLLFAFAHTVAWTLVPTLSRAPGSLWDDMLETYAWAQEWQLGYYKHPPLYAWIAGL